DGRFAVDQNGDIVLASGGLDFETEPSVSLTVTGTDNETNDTVSQSVSFSVTDANDPVTGILPAEATLKENVAGETVAELTVVDQDLDQEYLFSVDDSRFFVDEFDLRLLPGISVDYEASPNITVNVTVTEDVPGGSVFTGPVVIRVENFPEQPSTLSLSDHTITEFIYGDIVGDVFLDGVAPEARWEFSVNDSQFEFDGTTLKLLDDVFADRRDAQQIIVEVTATDSLSQFNDLTETFVIDVLENSLPGHNADLPNDVNHDGEITPLDALIIINYINAHGAGPVADSDLLRCYDVNGDGMITPLDALLIINFLNTPQTVGGGGTDDGGESEGGGAEGEFIPPQDLLPQTVPSDSIEELSPREFRVQLEATPETQRLIEGAPARRVAIVVRHQHVDDAIVDWETGEEVQSLRLFDGEKITT
ncbi:MAG: dockerin type I domain-containing protein, partial [Planctomycetota bacterium]